MNRTRKFESLIAGSILVLAVALAPNAAALAINDNNYVGRVTPSTPASEAAEAAYGNYLVDLFNGVETDTSSVSFTGLPTAQNFVLTTGGLTGVLPHYNAGTHLLNGGGVLDVSGTYNITGVQYIYAYYGNGAPTGGEDGQLWFVGNLTASSVSIPTKALSHVTLLSGGRSVPDAGTSLLLLGGSMLGIGALRRRLSK